jgi:Domain of unknown function (DUF4440)
MNSDEAAVWDTVKALNDCWIKGYPAGLTRFFHKTMVAETPADRFPLVGGDACVASWTRFAESVSVLGWQTHEPRVTIYGAAAVVTYLYELDCDGGGRTLPFAGRDMMFLIREAGHWSLVADQFSPYPAVQP